MDTYKARFHHFGAMIQESLILIDNYKPNLDRKDWIEEVLQKNVLGKSSRSWARELITGIFFPRFVTGPIPNVWQDIKIFKRSGFDLNYIKWVLYYLTSLSDEFIYDFTTIELYERYFAGKSGISAEDVYQFIQQIPPEKFNHPWSDYVKRRLARGIMATLHPFSHLRMHWRLPEWNNYSILQVRLTEKDTGKTTVTFHQEKLDNRQIREKMKTYWKEQLQKLSAILKE